MGAGGIDDIYIYTPELKLSADEYADGDRGFADLLKKGLGIKEKSVNEPSQDTVALAMNALDGLIESVGQEGVKYLYCGTESQVNLSKPVATNLMDLLDNKNVLTLDGVFACLSGLNLLVNGMGLGKGFVVTADIAKYRRKKGSSADFTGASGSAAVKVGEGKLLGVDKEFGAFSSNGWDFHKPIHVDGDEIRASFLPKVDGYFSFAAYVKHIGEAYKDLKSKKGVDLDDFSHVAFHVPYPGITKYALAYLNAIDDGDPGEIDEQLGRFKELFHNQESPGYKDLLKGAYAGLKSELRKFMNGSEKIDSSLKYPSVTGNIYTGSIFLSLASTLRHGKYVPGDRILVIGYGSGSGSTALSMTVTNETKGIVDSWELDERLAGRMPITLSEYNDFRKEGLTPNDNPQTSRWHLRHLTDFGKRIYEKMVGVPT